MPRFDALAYEAFGRLTVSTHARGTIRTTVTSAPLVLEMVRRPEPGLEVIDPPTTIVQYPAR